MQRVDVVDLDADLGLGDAAVLAGLCLSATVICAVRLLGEANIVKPGSSIATSKPRKPA